MALVHLAARLTRGRYRLLDTQFVTDHLTSLGAIEVPRRDYHRMLEKALVGRGDFLSWPRRIGGRRRRGARRAQPLRFNRPTPARKVLSPA